MAAATDVTAASCLLDDIPVAALVAAPDGSITSVNAAGTRLLGPIATRLPLDRVLLQTAPCAAPYEASPGWRTEARTVAGVPFLVDVSATVRADGSTLLVLREVTDSLLLAESARHLDAAFETAPIGMAFFDTEGRYIRVNHALCELLGRPAADLIGRRDSELTHPDDRQSDVDAAWRILRGEIDTWQTEKRFVRPDGAVTWAIANMSFLRDDERRPLTWLGQFQDITARKVLETQLRELAGKDPLTGLANRRSLDAAIGDAVALASRHGHGGALVYVDLDGFKAINDTYGHETGDTLLREAASAMLARCRQTDTVARIGGDEFAVLLPVATPEQARAVHAGLQDVLDRVTTEHRGTCVTLAATLGTTWFGPDAGLTADALLAAADRAMYAARTGDPAARVPAAAS